MRSLASSLALVSLLGALAGCGAAPQTPGERSLESARPTRLKVLAVRLLPGDDPKAALDRIVRERGIEGAFVLSCAGSLSRAVIRFADRKEPTTIEQKLEIVSLSGTLSATGGSHLHISVADGDGRTIGGHLKEGSAVYTTAEIAIGVAEGLKFTREPDARTGYSELFIESR